MLPLITDRLHTYRHFRAPIKRTHILRQHIHFPLRSQNVNKPIQHVQSIFLLSTSLVVLVLRVFLYIFYLFLRVALRPASRGTFVGDHTVPTEYRTHVLSHMPAVRVVFVKQSVYPILPPVALIIACTRNEANESSQRWRQCQ